MRAKELFSLFAVLLLLSACAGVSAPSATSVGYVETQIPNGEEPPLVVGIWYPASAAAEEHRLGLATQEVALRAPVVGNDLPTVVISHGGGGSLASHYDTALALARAGFVVAAVTHAGDTYDDQSRVLQLWRRPAHVSRVITFLLDQWPERARLDPEQIGAFGFSNGGFTVLAAAGGVDPYSETILITTSARPWTKAASPRWRSFLFRLTRGVVTGVSKPLSAPRQLSAPPFDTAGLENVTVPVQLWRASQ